MRYSIHSKEPGVPPETRRETHGRSDQRHLGRADPPPPRHRVAGARGPAPRGRRRRAGRRPLGAVRLPAVQQRLRRRHRGQGRADGRRARARRRHRQPRAARPQGPLRQHALGVLARPPDAPAGAGGGPAGRDRLGHRDGPDRGGVAAPAGREGAALPRLLHLRPAVPRGVLHAGGDREGRARHAAHGRQHPAVHRHQRGGVQGVVRRRRPARLVHRHRALRRDLPVRPQHARDPDGAVGPDPGPHPRRGPAPHRLRRPPAHRGRRRGRAHRRRAPRAPGRAPTWP